MRRITFFAFVSILLFFVSCKDKFSTKENPSTQIITATTGTELEGNEQDGIVDIQKLEFERTKDIRLGYVPKYRLINAMEEIKAKRKNGTYPQSLSALAWTERGPNTDALGPSNGNTRGTQSASDAVTSGRIRAIWVDLTNPKIVWVGGVDGGLWKTNDISSNLASAWSPVNDLFGNLAIGGICQDPSNTNIMYFGTGEKTFNVDAVRGGGIWKSVDHGVSWNLLPNTTSFYNVSRIVCDASGNVYVATIGNGAGIQRSKNGGSSWTDITPTGLSSRVTEMKLGSNGKLHIVCGYISTPSGYRYTANPATVNSGSWTSPTTAFTSTTYNVELALSSDGNTLYALPCNSSYKTPQIWKSTDGGANWSATSTSPPSTNNSNSSINTGQGWYDLALGVDPSDANHVIAGGLNFYKTTNGGTSWSQLTRWVGTSMQYVHADHHAVVWNGTQVLLGSDGGLFYSNDDGNTFVDRNDGLRLKQFYACALHPTLTNYFLAGAQDNGVHQLNGSGLTGSLEVTGGDGAFVHIDQNEPQYQFGAYVYNNYYKSTDGGASWSSVSYGNSGSFINPSDYDDIENNFYAAYSTGKYLLWLNAPNTNIAYTNSVSQFNGGTVSSVSVSDYTSNRVFFGIDNGRIVRVDDANTGSITATNITGTGMDASNVSCIALGTADNNLLATFSNYGANHVWVSTTGGGAGGWTNITGNLPDIPVRWAMFYPNDNTKAILATEMGIFETDLINGSSTNWVQNASFPTVRTNMLQYRASDRTLLAATHGRGLWTAILPTVLPVNIISFSGYLNNRQSCELIWKTTNQVNLDWFEIQRSYDGVQFETIGNLNATQSTSSIGDYNFTDPDLAKAVNFYRLKMVDIDGKIQFSNIIKIKNDKPVKLIELLQNPVRNNILFVLKNPAQQKVDAALFGNDGRLINNWDLGTQQGTISLSIDRFNLSKGIYYLNIRAGTYNETLKLNKQ